MQRRNFLKNTIWTVGALSLPLSGNKVLAGSATSTSPAAYNFKKSIMWGSAGIEGSVFDKCKAIKEAGFQGIETASHMNRREVIDAAKATGLAITSVYCSTHWSKPLSHPDAAVRQEGIEGAIVALEDAHAYGTDAMLLVHGVVNNTVSYDDCWIRSVEAIRKLLPVAERLKVKICLENAGNNFLLSPLEALYYIDQFNSPYVKFYFDCGNVLVYYDWPEQWIKILGDRTGRIHIKDFNRQIADKQGRRAGLSVPLTEGDVNWSKVMESLRNHYENVWLTTEQGSNKTLEELKDLSARFDKILNM